MILEGILTLSLPKMTLFTLGRGALKLRFIVHCPFLGFPPEFLASVRV